MSFNIRPERTAISNGVSLSCKMLYQDYLNLRDTITVLDYGCGKLRNTNFLVQQEFHVDITDTDLQLHSISKYMSDLKNVRILNIKDIENNKIPKKYNAILLSFVLNTIPDIQTRKQVLLNIKKLMFEDAVLYIEVRDTKFIKNLKHYAHFNDGLLIGKNKIKTFQKPYTTDEIVSFSKEMGFEVSNIKKKSGSIVIKLNKKTK